LIAQLAGDDLIGGLSDRPCLRLIELLEPEINLRGGALDLSEATINPGGMRSPEILKFVNER